MKPRKDIPIVKEPPVTYDDYATLPDDGNRFELVAGALELLAPAPSPRHQVVGFQMAATLRDSCQEDYIIFVSPIDLILSETELRQPDIVMVHRSRMDIITKRGIEGAPDLVAEILSPFSVKRDKVSKRATYAAYGIPEYWIVDPSNACIEQYVLAEDGAYALANLFAKDDTVLSERITCASFTMEEIMRWAEDLPG